MLAKNLNVVVSEHSMNNFCFTHFTGKRKIIEVLIHFA